MSEARFKTLRELQAEINKEMKGEVLVLGSDVRQDIPRLSTGILSYDLAMGGGWAMNQWNELVGNESSGKTALAFKTIAHNQAIDPEFLALWVAAEEWVPSYALSFGVDLERLWVVETNEMEPVLNLVNKAIGNRAVDIVVIDSLPALVAEAEIAKDMEDSLVAPGARILSRFFKKSTVAQRRDFKIDSDVDRPCTMIAINQWRDKIGFNLGDPRTTPGGKAKNYFFFIRLELSRKEWIKEGSKTEDAVGQVMKIRVMKNKTYRPNQTAEVDFYFADTKHGEYKMGEFDTIKDLVYNAVALEVIKRAGATYTFGDYKWRGKDCVDLIIPPDVRADRDLREALATECKRVVAEGIAAMPTEEPDHEDEPVVVLDGVDDE